MNEMWHERGMLAFHGDLGLMMIPVLAKMRNYAVGKTDCVNVLEGLCERIQGNVGQTAS